MHKHPHGWYGIDTRHWQRVSSVIDTADWQWAWEPGDEAAEAVAEAEHLLDVAAGYHTTLDYEVCQRCGQDRCLVTYPYERAQDAAFLWPADTVIVVCQRCG